MLEIFQHSSTVGINVGKFPYRPDFRGSAEQSYLGSVGIWRYRPYLTILILPQAPLREFSFVREKRNVCTRAIARRVYRRSAFRAQMKTRGGACGSEEQKHLDV